jgi:hypothetical protein
MKQIIDFATGQVSFEEVTEQDLEQMELDNAAFHSGAQVELDKAAAKAALLERLGITADEAKLLLS